MFCLLIGLGFIFICSTIGGFYPYIYKEEKQLKAISILMGFAAGVMLASSIWSLIVPAIEMSNSYIMVLIGFLIGVLLIVVLDILSLKTNRNINKVDKMYLAVSIHNIPEGIIVGLAFGVGVMNGDLYSGALIALAIGIQNLPESIALSISLYNEIKDKKKTFLKTMFSGSLEVISGLIGFFLVVYMNNIISLFLSIAGGCMVYVVLSEMVPEAVEEDNIGGRIGIIIGFIIMMTLDVIL